jgi:hypothetical protein
MPTMEPASLYWLIFSCPCCGRRTRASTALRAWSRIPSAILDDAEAMWTRGGGPGRITNVRASLWDALERVTEVRASVRLRGDVSDFFYELSRRLSDGASTAQRASSACRYSRPTPPR